MGGFIGEQLYFSPNKSGFGEEVLSSRIEEPKKKNTSLCRSTRQKQKKKASAVVRGQAERAT